MSVKFQYIGDPNDRFSGPDPVEHRGIVFPKGETVDVPDETAEDKERIRRLNASTHFINVSEGEQSPDAPPAPVPRKTRGPNKKKAG